MTKDWEKEFDKKFVIKLQDGYLMINPTVDPKLIKTFIRQREKDLLEDIKEKVLQSLMWSDKHGKEEQFSALANYLDSKLKELSNE